MGFNSKKTELTLTAKLTPLGRQKLVSTNNGLIKTFSLGDSDANYYSNLILPPGQVPNCSGNIGIDNTINTSTTQSVALKTALIVNATGVTRKPVSSQSVNILTEKVYLGQKTIDDSDLTRNIVNRNNLDIDPLVNLLYSFNLPLNSADDSLYNNVKYVDGGYSNTAFKSLSTEKVLIIGINEDQYGELIDGKSLKIKLENMNITYTIYSSFQGNLTNVNSLDVLDSDNHQAQKQYGDNVVMLFSDEILKPNGGDENLSWSTGYNTNKPYSTNGKKTFNFQTDTNLGTVKDKPVGIAYLAKGFIVITDKRIVDSFDVKTSLIELTFDSSITNIYQSITCLADRGEFGSTTNPTFEGDDVPRISEVGLFDELGNLIAIAKSDRHITKNINEFMALEIKIVI